jgi:hypothetical protein
MAFCNSCGAALNPGSSFCSKCGAAVAGSPTSASKPVPPASIPPAPPVSTGGGSSGLKIILIVILVIIGLGILGLAGLGFVAHRFLAGNIHVSQDGNHVKVDTPFGTTETSQDPEQIAKDLGVEIYPGAQVQKNGAATATFGSVRTLAASFESSDSPDKVCDFYKSRFANSLVRTTGSNHCSIISNDPKNMITINIEADGDNTKLQITSVSKKPTSGSSN